LERSQLLVRREGKGEEKEVERGVEESLVCATRFGFGGECERKKKRRARWRHTLLCLKPAASTWGRLGS
jgi:hypothetical protein